jgi:pimeloyl-ACP methyl ester carboxylesterase
VTPITARSVRVGGGRVLLVEAGEGPPVLLLHGVGGTFRYWLETVHRLSRTHRVLAADLPGFGGSDAAHEPFELLAAGERVLAACEAVGAHAPVLVGHSLAGPAVAQVAARSPERVAGIVLVGSASLSPQQPWRRYVLPPAARIALRRPRACENVLVDHPRIRRLLFRDLFDVPDDLPPDETRMLVGGASLARQLRDSLDATLSFDLRPLLPRLRVPLGLVWGERDRTSPIGDYELARELVPDARARLVHGAGHMPMLERPDAFAGALAAVLPGAQASI